MIFFGFKFVPGFQKPIISLRAPSEPSAPWRFGRTEKVICFLGGGSCPSRKKGHETRKTLLIHPIWVVKLEQTFFFKREHPETLGEGSEPMSTEPHIFSDGLVENHQFFSNFLMYICYRGLLWLLCLGPKSHLRKAAGIFYGVRGDFSRHPKKRSCFMRRNGYSPGNSHIPPLEKQTFS